jgi:hypothetical protein
MVDGPRARAVVILDAFFSSNDNDDRQSDSAGKSTRERDKGSVAHCHAHRLLEN